MTRGRLLAGAAVALGIVLGTVADSATKAVVRVAGTYQVLAVDFHVHPFPQSWSTLSPFETVVEARRHALDAIAITPHNQVWVAKLGRWFANLTGGPIVIVGEEITASGFHMLGVGITKTISYDQNASGTIREIHRQGGVAIVAHPYPNTWASFDAAALEALDGAEVVRPEAMYDERAAEDLRTFFAKGSFAAIGSTDFHGLGEIGTGRTYVFAYDRTAGSIVDAVRAGRTVVFDRDRVYGNRELLTLLKDREAIATQPPPWPRPELMRVLSRFLAVVGLAAVLLIGKATTLRA
jgi:predicted metal-dependent phosphoesterase TrpH